MAKPVVDSQAILDTCDTEIPDMALVKQGWELDSLDEAEVVSTAYRETFALASDSDIEGEVAIGVGSRGITNIDMVVSGVVEAIRDAGLLPFIIPAMGSHGGGDAESQKEKLESLGVSEETMGCEIRSTMETREVSELSDVPIDKHAYDADGILVVNRIKKHTAFSNDVESGLSKMLVVGVGNREGASQAHSLGESIGMGEAIKSISEGIRSAQNVLGGVGIVENEDKEIEAVEAIPDSPSFIEKEASVLEKANSHFPTIPFDDLDLVIVDAMGKDISGAGMDPNTLGTSPGGDDIDIDKVYTRRLTEKSAGNATGLNQADFIHQELYEDIDVEKSTINSLTAGYPGIVLPSIMETDEAAIKAALSICEGDKVVRIQDTENLEYLQVSESLVDEGLDVISAPSPFDMEAGDLVFEVEALKAQHG